IIDKATRAEANGEIEAREEEDDEIKRPAENKCLGEEENQAGSQQENRPDGLGKAMRSRVILHNARLQQVQRLHHATIEEPERTNSRNGGTHSQRNSPNQDQHWRLK